MPRDRRALPAALLDIHRPNTTDDVEHATHRLKWDEALTLQLTLASRRRAHDEIDVTGVEAERDSALNDVENALSAFDPPVADNDQ